MQKPDFTKISLSAYNFCGIQLPLQPIKDGTMYYVGAKDLKTGATYRDSCQHFYTFYQANAALTAADWVQRR